MIEPSPTVIVARQPAPGREDEFSRWSKKLNQAAETFPGYIASEVQPPDDAHPDEWVTIYRFASQSDLDRWLNSGARRSLMMEGEDLVVGITREQRIAQVGVDAVSAVLSKRVTPANLEAYREAELEIRRAMSRFPGFVNSQVYEPIPGVQDEHITVFSFETREQLDDWLTSAERQQALGSIEELSEGEFTLNVVGGFGGWFNTESPDSPPKWKQGISVLLPLYPTVVVLSKLQGWLFPDALFLPALFISNVLSVAALTWILMPRVTRWLRPWLQA